MVELPPVVHSPFLPGLVLCSRCRQPRRQGRRDSSCREPALTIYRGCSGMEFPLLSSFDATSRKRALTGAESDGTNGVSESFSNWNAHRGHPSSSLERRLLGAAPRALNPSVGWGPGVTPRLLWKGGIQEKASMGCSRLNQRNAPVCTQRIFLGILLSLSNQNQSRLSQHFLSKGVPLQIKETA